MNNYAGSNVKMDYSVGQVYNYAPKKNNFGYTPTIEASDKYTPTTRRNKSADAGGIVAGIALGIAALVGMYKGHNKIAGVVKAAGRKKAAYQASHANMSLKGLKKAGKNFGGTIINLVKSAFNVPKTLGKETVKMFKKTV